ncbi:MAG: transporter substrate-binding domain-containing protein [Methylobacteriaceae bacterium]|nr:transporter substrate-binding domain-containing protein [Methylobacteriaceae bacterium]
MRLPRLRALAIVVACGALAALPQAEARAQTLPHQIRIASEGARPPYNYIDNGELSGFEIELGRELCARIVVTCTFVAQDWDSMIPGLLDHQYDAIMAAMEISDERREKIAFTKPYVRMPASFVVNNKSALHDISPDGLAGKTIGVENGSPEQAFAEDIYKKSEVKRYASLEEAILDLAEERLDTALGDKDAVIDFLKNRREGKCCKLLADAPRDPVYFGEGIGVGLRKEDVALRAAFDKAIDEVMADGTFAKIRAKYFDFAVN